MDEEYTLPSAEALMAGTMALLTGYAQSAPDCANRPLMAKKVVSNLFFLAAHPHISAPMQTMLGNLRTRWQLELERDMPAKAGTLPRELWHPKSELVQ
jgi:hypothetical protein